MITLPIDLELILERGHVRPLGACDLIYDPQDPYAVLLLIVDDLHGTEVAWLMARELFANGLGSQTEPRAGDVRIWRCNELEMHIALESPEGRAELHAPAEDIAHFLELTYQAVPPGHEMDGVDIGAELAAMFGEAA
ncbi:SsgA family sporulation/cell division regulator [Streptomyces sp. NPDC088747]|uniref:SsgA family sporulation/cell division regulator n=1 Tax=Streptomyces sp. NPDC088747 TaxID=3365886 RepID=UPI00381440A9